MPNEQSIKYKMSGGLTNKTKKLCLGGYKSNDPDGIILSNLANNIYENIPLAEFELTANDQYLCFYVENGDIEAVQDLKFWLFDDTIAGNTEVKYAFENPANAHPYKFAPAYTATGSSFIDVADSTALRLLQFSASCWFRTSATLTEDGLMVNKGGSGSDTAGENMNYGIGMNTNGTIFGTFESGSGTDRIVTSPLAYNDGKWHFAVITYDQVTLRLFIDGTEVATLATTDTPETNSKPLRIGANSRALDRYFNGLIDEVRIWNNDLTAPEISALYSSGTVPQTSALVYENKFGEDDGLLIAQTIPNINTSPVGVTWLSASQIPPTDILFKNFKPGDSFPVWVWYHINAGYQTKRDERSHFTGSFRIKTLGTGDPGGGNPTPVPTIKKIVTVGDMGCSSTTDDIVDLIIDLDPDVWLFVGDGSYESLIDCFLAKAEKIKNKKIKMFIAFGNHDVDKSAKKEKLLSLFEVSNTWGSAEIDNVHFCFLDSESSFSTNSSQYKFFAGDPASLDPIKKAGDLKTASLKGNIDWIIAIVHRPWYGPSGQKHPVNEGDIVQKFMPLFNQYHVDYIGYGHNHNNQVSYPINGNNPTPNVVDSGPGPYIDKDGRIAFSAGTGGRDKGDKLYELPSKPSYQAFQDDQANAVFEITFSNNGKTTTNKFINIEKETLYSFVIQKSS